LAATAATALAAWLLTGTPAGASPASIPTTAAAASLAVVAASGGSHGGGGHHSYGGGHHSYGGGHHSYGGGHHSYGGGHHSYGSIGLYGGYGGYSYYSPYYGGYGYGGYGYGGYGYGRYGYGGYGYGGYGYPYRYRYRRIVREDGVRLGALDLEVKPGRTEVFLDGEYVGLSGQFDGNPSYLWVEEGVHELTFYKDGYQSVVREVSVQPGLSVNLRSRLEPGTSSRPEPPPEPAVAEPPETGGAGEVAGDSPGRLIVAVAPNDAVLYLDGHFFGVANELQHVHAGLPVAAGEHSIEIIRPGYRALERVITVKPGESVSLEATLRPR